MKSLIVLLALTATFASPVSARIGESKQQCIARYGKPLSVKKTDADLYFIKTGYGVGATFDKDICTRIVFVRMTEKETPLTKKEVATLLKANAANQEWEKIKVEPTDPDLWLRKDGKVVAMHPPEKKGLILMTRARFQVLLNKWDAEEKKAAKKPKR